MRMYVTCTQVCMKIAWFNGNPKVDGSTEI